MGSKHVEAHHVRLHQHFLRNHAARPSQVIHCLSRQAWYVRGLIPAGDGRRPPDDKEALRSRVAGHLLEVQRMQKKEMLNAFEVMEGKASQGLDLKMLAVFVATLVPRLLKVLRPHAPRSISSTETSGSV